MDHVKEMTAKTALHCHNSKWLPYKYDINVYRGCAHRCVYCYALYSHEYIGSSDFYDEIYQKTNIADVLKRELPEFSKQTVNLGGVTDSYQPAERECKLMPDVLQLLAQYKVPTVLSTKSTLILRDIELLRKVKDAGGLAVAFTITTMDEIVARLIEPNAPKPAARMKAVKQINAKGLSCGVHLMPIIPFLTSSEQSLEAVFDSAKDAGAGYILASALNLKGRTRAGFFDSIRQAFPAQYHKIWQLYNDKQAYGVYKQALKKTLYRLRKKYGLPEYRALPELESETQLSFL